MKNIISRFSKIILASWGPVNVAPALWSGGLRFDSSLDNPSLMISNNGCLGLGVEKGLRGDGAINESVGLSALWG